MIVLIKAIEVKESTTGKTYWTITTDQGKMSIWNSDVHKQIKGLVGKGAEVETVKKGDYTNITKFIKEVSTPQIVNGDKFQDAREDKTWSMRESYAKDIFGMLLDKDPIIMDGSKQEEQCKKLAELAVKIENILRIGTNKLEENNATQ